MSAGRCVFSLVLIICSTTAVLSAAAGLETFWGMLETVAFVLWKKNTLKLQNPNQQFRSSGEDWAQAVCTHVANGPNKMQL